MNTTIARLGFQSLFGQKRGVVVILLPVFLLVLAVGLRVITAEPGIYTGVVIGFGLTIMVPLVALLVTNGVIGPELDDGSIVYLLAKPISRHTVAVSKLLVAIGVSAAINGLSLLVAGLVIDLDETRQTLAVVVAALVASAAYCSLFLALSAVNRHGMVTGLLYVLGFELLLAASLDGLAHLSVMAIARRIGLGIDGGLDVANQMSVVYAWIAAVVILVAGAILAGERLSRYQLRGEE